MTGAPAADPGAGTTGVPNRLRGEFAAVLAGEALRFDTTLATVAAVEERCGGIAIVEAVERAVFGRRAADALALIAGALGAMGHPDAEARAGRTTSLEAEGFVLALMGALGFEVARKPAPEEAARDPFGGAPRPAPSAGPAGAASRSAP